MKIKRNYNNSAFVDDLAKGDLFSFVRTVSDVNMYCGEGAYVNLTTGDIFCYVPSGAPEEVVIYDGELTITPAKNLNYIPQGARLV